MSFTGPIVTTDAVVVQIREGALRLLTIIREREPFIGRRALPGVYVSAGETIQAATDRCLATKAELELPPTTFRRTIDVYDSIDRDPRGHALSVVTVAILPTQAPVNEPATLWSELSVELAFDHEQIVRNVITWIDRNMWTDREVMRALVGDRPLSTSTLLSIARMLGHHETDTSNFRRRIAASGMFQATTTKIANTGPGRPSALWDWTD